MICFEKETTVVKKYPYTLLNSLYLQHTVCLKSLTMFLFCMFTFVQGNNNKYILNITNHGTSGHVNPNNKIMEFELAPPAEVHCIVYS